MTCRPARTRREATRPVSSIGPPGNVQQALAMARAGLGYLAAADPTAMATETQARCLRELERLDAMGTAARALILGAFTSGDDYAADAAHSAGSWLVHRTKVTRAAAAGHVGWARRAAAHPEVAAALAEGDVVSESVARKLCSWTDQLPAQCRDAADEILVGAARAGADEEDLARLAAEMIARSRPTDSDDGRAFEDRAVTLETTFDGAGVLRGELTPECAAVLAAVLESLSAPVGADDERTHAQRYHDALAEAARRLVASGMLPERAGQPVRGIVHVSLADLMVLDADSKLQDEWITRERERWAAARAGVSVAGGDGGAWLDEDAARAVTCDAALTPVVTADVNVAALDDLVRLCVELDRMSRDGAEPSGRSREALEKAIIGKAVDLLSGPGGLASFLRTRELGARLGGPSLPLDVGFSEDVPTSIRRAVTLRAQGHCEWPGGCRQPAAACEVHHITPKSRGGKTSVTGCVLLCFFHHQVCVHRMSWTLVLNPDGTTTAWNSDRTRVLRSHGPPPRPG